VGTRGDEEVSEMSARNRYKRERKIRLQKEEERRRNTPNFVIEGILKEMRKIARHLCIADVIEG
jgi:hypothetical protein